MGLPFERGRAACPLRLRGLPERVYPAALRSPLTVFCLLVRAGDFAVRRKQPRAACALRHSRARLPGVSDGATAEPPILWRGRRHNMKDLSSMQGGQRRAPVGGALGCVVRLRRTARIDVSVSLD